MHLAVAPDGEDRGLVGQVGQVGAGEAGRAPGHHVQVHVRGEVLVLGVHGQDGRPLGQRGQRDRDLPVEAARPQQRWVEHLGPVRGGEHDDALSDVEPVHLGQQLVQGLLALVVGHRRARAGPALADGVDLVDEDDRGRPLARLGEQVAHPRGADADEQLDEAGAGHGEERHRGLTGHGPGQQGLAGSGRADHQRAARSDGPGPLVALGVAQEVDHLADFLLHPRIARHVGELGARPLGVEHLGPRPAHAQHALQPARAPAGGLSHPPEHPEDQQQGQDQHEQRQQDRAQARAGRRVVGVQAVRFELVVQRRGGLTGDDGGVGLAVGQVTGRYRVRAVGAVLDVGRLDLVRGGAGLKLGEVQVDRRRRVNRRQEDVQHNGRQEGQGPQPVPPARRRRRSGFGGAVPWRRRRRLFAHTPAYATRPENMPPGRGDRSTPLADRARIRPDLCPG